MPTPEVISATNNRSLLPVQQLDILQQEIQGLNNRPITADERNTLKNRLDDIRVLERTIEQETLKKVESQIAALPDTASTPPPDITDSLPLEHRETIKQTTDFFTKAKTWIVGLFTASWMPSFVRNWAQQQLRDMGMGEYADELRSPEEKKKAEDDKRTKEEAERTEEATRRKKEAESRPEYIEDLDGRQKKAYALALVKAFYDKIGKKVPQHEEGKSDALYARQLGIALANALDQSQDREFNWPCALEISGNGLQATDTARKTFFSWLRTAGQGDYYIPNMKTFREDLINNPEQAFKNFLTINTNDLDTQSKNAVLELQTALFTAARDLQPAPEVSRPAPNTPRPVPTTTASTDPAADPTTATV